MFLDLKDSTPISEQLGHEKYFLFIKDFVYCVSKAILENEGMIYQYVGDEVVVTWPFKKSNILKSMNAVIDSRSAFTFFGILF
jgi:adenylate cyclase